MPKGEQHNVPTASGLTCKTAGPLFALWSRSAVEHLHDTSFVQLSTTLCPTLSGWRRPSKPLILGPRSGQHQRRRREPKALLRIKRSQVRVLQGPPPFPERSTSPVLCSPAPASGLSRRTRVAAASDR